MNVRLRLRFFSLAVLTLTHTKVAPNTMYHITPPPPVRHKRPSPPANALKYSRWMLIHLPFQMHQPLQAPQKKARKPRVVLLKAGKVTDLSSTVAAYLYSEMKTGINDMSIAAQSDWMFKKYHRFQHTGEGTPARTNKVHYDSIKTHLAQVKTVPVYELFLNGTQQYKEC
jgi:hypothetical protein